MLMLLVVQRHLGSRRFYSSLDLLRAGRLHDLEKPFLRSKSFGQKCNSLPLSAQYLRVIIGNLVVHLYNEEWGGFRLSGDFSLSGNFDGPPVLWSSLVETLRHFPHVGEAEMSQFGEGL